MKFSLARKLKALIDGAWKINETIESFDTWSESEKREFSNRAFLETVRYCFDHVPYYRNWFQENGIDHRGIHSLEEIAKLPLLTKDIIRQNKGLLRSDELGTMKFISRRSGGTTGEPIESLISQDARSYETLLYFKGLKTMGWDENMTTVKLFGGSLGIGKAPSFREKIYSYVTNSIFLPAFEISPETIEVFHALIKDKKNVCFIGYPSAINNFADSMKAKALSLNNVRLAIATSEQLIEDWRVNIQDTFQCEVRSYYGCGEIQSIGYQQKGGGQEYLIPREHVYLESATGTGELIITQLHNRAQPLLRYINGDVGMLDQEIFSTRIVQLTGRTADYFRRTNGTLVSPILGTYSIQRSLVPVKKYQYIQLSDGSIEFRYQMERGEMTSEYQEVISKIVDYVMGEPTRLIFHESADFEMSASGKYRICVSKMNA